MRSVIFSRQMKFILFIVGSFLEMSSVEAFTGSAQFKFHHRTYGDEILKDGGATVGGDAVNYEFPSLRAFEVDATFGLTEFDVGIEPTLLIGFGQRTSNRFEAGGGPAALRYQIFTVGLGARYQPYRHNTFLVIPYAEILALYRVGTFKVLSSNSAIHSNDTMGSIGLGLGGGFIVSFFGDVQRKSELKAEWELMDFGAVISARYSLPDLMNHGRSEILGKLDLIDSYELGMGLLIDW